MLKKINWILGTSAIGVVEVPMFGVLVSAKVAHKLASATASGALKCASATKNGIEKLNNWGETLKEKAFPNVQKEDVEAMARAWFDNIDIYSPEEKERLFQLLAERLCAVQTQKCAD